MNTNFVKNYMNNIPLPSQYFAVNSADRQYGSNVQFNTKNLYNFQCRSFALKSICFPYMCYSVNSLFNKLIIGTNVYTIPEGNYTPNTFLTAVNGAQSEIVLTYSSTTNKYSYSSGSSKTIIFDSRNNNFAKYFGFAENSSNVCNTTLDSVYPIQFTYTRWIDVISSTITQDGGSSQGCPSSLIARIPAEIIPYGATYYYTDTYPHVIGNSFDRPINYLDIEIRDDRGNLLNIPLNAEFMLLFEKFQ